MGIRLKSLKKRDKLALWLFLGTVFYLCESIRQFLFLYIWGRELRGWKGIFFLFSGALLIIGAALYFRRYPKEQWMDIRVRKIDRINVELLLCIFAFIVGILCDGILSAMMRDRVFGLMWLGGSRMQITQACILLFMPLISVGLGCVVLAMRKVWRNVLRQDSLIWSMVENLKVGRPFEKQVRLEKVPFLLFATAETGLIVFACWSLTQGYLYNEVWTLLIAVLVVVAYILYLSAVFHNRVNRDVDRLLKQIEDMASGNLDAKPIEEEDSLLYKGSGELASVGGNLKHILEKQMQSERTKINLITNVSHDLKTPLTSMIGYVDLLKKEELPETARDYIEVISTKQEQLKNMIQDIFELSRSTSGDVQLELEELDMVKLLDQTLADMEDAIQESTMDIRKNEPDVPMRLIGDGKKLYRVFQNLVGNALKYSLKGTRIYIQTEKYGEMIQVTVKNTASYEMQFTPEEIMERFTRGDESRNTEGHGLGLAIAESFTKNMGGEFKLDIDGDQFRVQVSFQSI